MKVGDLIKDRETDSMGIIIRFDSFGFMYHILYFDGTIKCHNGGFLEVVCK